MFLSALSTFVPFVFCEVLLVLFVHLRAIAAKLSVLLALKNMALS
jgi:hypothetical protein